MKIVHRGMVNIVGFGTVHNSADYHLILKYYDDVSGVKEEVAIVLDVKSLEEIVKLWKQFKGYKEEVK